MRTDIRNKVAVGIAILSFGAFFIGLNSLADFLGAETYVDFGETVTVVRGSGRYSYEEEIDGETTDVGMYILIASAMLAWRIYHWIFSGSIDGNLRLDQRRTWNYWFLGLTAFVIISTPIWRLDIPDFLQGLIVMAIAAGILFFFWNKYSTADDD